MKGPRSDVKGPCIGGTGGPTSGLKVQRIGLESPGRGLKGQNMGLQGQWRDLDGPGRYLKSREEVWKAR